MSDEILVKVRVLSQTWLVPEALVSVDLRSAITHLNELGEWQAVTWTEGERAAIGAVVNNPKVWTL